MSNKRIAELDAQIEVLRHNMESAKAQFKQMEIGLADAQREKYQLVQAAKTASRAKAVAKPTAAGLDILRAMHQDRAIITIGAYASKTELVYPDNHDDKGQWRSRFTTLNRGAFERLVDGGFVARLVWVEQSDAWKPSKLYGLTPAGIAAVEAK